MQTIVQLQDSNIRSYKTVQDTKSCQVTNYLILVQLKYLLNQLCEKVKLFYNIVTKNRKTLSHSVII